MMIDDGCEICDDYSRCKQMGRCLEFGTVITMPAPHKFAALDSLQCLICGSESLEGHLPMDEN